MTDKLAHIQEPEQLEDKHRDEAVEQDIEAKYGMQEQYLVEGTVRQETCKSQTGGKPDLEYGRFGEYIKQLEERWAKLEDRLTDHVEAEIESRAAKWREYMAERQKVLDDDRASIVEQTTAGSKKLKQGFETNAENLKDLMAQSCRAGTARVTDLEETAEELEAESATVFRAHLTNATPSVLVSSISSRR